MPYIVLIHLIIALILYTTLYIFELVLPNLLNKNLAKKLHLFFFSWRLSLYHTQPVEDCPPTILTIDEQSLVFDCLTAAFILYHQTTSTFRSELERRGFEDLVQRIEMRKNALPVSLQKQVHLYIQRKKLNHTM